MKPHQKRLVIWILDDGKPGHRNQSLGLAEAIHRQADATIHVVPLPPKSGFFSRFKKLREETKKLPKPGVIIAAGHRTHILLIYLARITGGRSVLLMRPSLPCAWFDHCLIPEHDFAVGEKTPDNVILTKGALNRVACNPEDKDGSGLFLIGGESKEFGFDGEALASAIKQIVAHYPDTKWSVTDSRRTPEDFLDSLKDSGISAFPNEQTDADWLPRHLGLASIVWVSEDSVSMIYEALSSGAQVGLLPMPRVRAAGRVARGIDMLIEEGRICHYEAWQRSGELCRNVSNLAESDRCAGLILSNF